VAQGASFAGSVRWAELNAVLATLAVSHIATGYVVVNVSFFAPLVRLVAQLKRVARIVMPKDPSTWRELEQQVKTAGLRIANYYFELPVFSELVVLLLEQEPTPAPINRAITAKAELARTGG
jgi:hypothetical protein